MNEHEHCLLQVVWDELQHVPSYVEQQAAQFAAEYTPTMVVLEDGSVSGRPPTNIWNVSDYALDEVD